MAKTDTEILNICHRVKPCDTATFPIEMLEVIKKMNKLEKGRLEALQTNIKIGCENCSQFDEIFGCSKCEQTLSI